MEALPAGLQAMLAQLIRTVWAFRLRKELPATPAGISAPDSRFSVERFRTVTLAELIRTVRAFRLRKELLATPAGINAPDSRSAAARIGTVALVSLSEFEALPAGLQAMLAQLFRTVRTFGNELLAIPAGINAPDSRFAAEERIRTVALVSLSEFEALSAELRAMMAQLFRTGRAFRKELPATPAGINAPDSRFAAKRIRMVARVSPSDFEALSAGLQAMLA